MNRLAIAALCAISLSALSTAVRADDPPAAAAPPADAPAAAAPAAAPPADAPAAAAPAASTHKWAHLDSAHEDLEHAKASIAKSRENHKDKGTLGGHGAKAIEHVDAAIKHVADAAAFADSHPDKKGHHPGKETLKEKHHPAKDDAKYPNLGAARIALEKADFQIGEGRQYHKPIGGLGGNAEKAQKEIKKAIHEIDAAEKFADKAAAKKK